MSNQDYGSGMLDSDDERVKTLVSIIMKDVIKYGKYLKTIDTSFQEGMMIIHIALTVVRDGHASFCKDKQLMFSIFEINKKRGGEK